MGSSKSGSSATSKTSVRSSASVSKGGKGGGGGKGAKSSPPGKKGKIDPKKLKMMQMARLQRSIPHGLDIINKVDYFSIQENLDMKKEDNNNFCFNVMDKRAHRIFKVEKLSSCCSFELIFYDFHENVAMTVQHPCTCCCPRMTVYKGRNYDHPVGTTLRDFGCACQHDFTIKSKVHGKIIRVDGSACVCLCKRTCNEYKIVDVNKRKNLRKMAKKRRKKKNMDEADESIVGKIVKESIGMSGTNNFGVYCSSKSIPRDVKALLIATAFLIICPIR